MNQKGRWKLPLLLAVLAAVIFLVFCWRIDLGEQSPLAPLHSYLTELFSGAGSSASGLGAGEPAREEGEKRILVIETTDIHGFVVDSSSGKEETVQNRLAYIAGLVDEARSSGRYDDVILLDGGDLYQGPPISVLTSGAIARAAVDQMHYDAVALGNHEFDWEVTQYAADKDGTIAPYSFGDYSGDPDTPVLASNLYDAETGERVPFTKDYVILEKCGLRIAVIGYIPNYRKSILTEKIRPYTIDEDKEKLAALVKKVNETEKPDATIILAHAKPLPVAEAMDPQQVDLVAGGHSHEITAQTASNGIPCIQGNCHAQGLSSALLRFHKDGTVTVEDVKYTDIMDNEKQLFDTKENAAHLDPAVLAVSRSVWQSIEEMIEDELGYIDMPIVKKYELGSSSAGNWVTGLMLQATEADGAVAAFYNTGGIRSEIKLPSGEKTRTINAYDVYSMMPYGNKILLYDLTGPELAQQLVNGLRLTNYGDQVSGLSFTYSATGDEDTDRSKREYTILGITMDDGTEVDLNDPTALYRVSIISYCASYPGSVFEGKEPVLPVEDALPENESCIAALRIEARSADGYIAVDTRERSERLAG